MDNNLFLLFLLFYFFILATLVVRSKIKKNKKKKEEIRNFSKMSEKFRHFIKRKNADEIESAFWEVATMYSDDPEKVKKIIKIIKEEGYDDLYKKLVSALRD